MSLITVFNWPACSEKIQTSAKLDLTWQFVIREDLRRHVMDARLPGIVRREMIHVVFGPAQSEPVSDKTVVVTAEIRPHDSPEDPVSTAARLASFLGNAMKERLDEGWRAEIFVHLHTAGIVHSGFWAG